MMIFNGMPVFVNDLAVKVHGKVHASKSWHWRRSYHKRIEKKWAKRYGPPIYEPCIIQMGRNLVVHPALVPALQKAASAIDF